MSMSLTVLPDWSEFDQQARRKSQQGGGGGVQSGQGGQDTQQQMVEEEQNQTQSLMEAGAVLAFISMILRDLKPVLMLIELIFSVLNLIFMPIALILYRLLAPVLIWILQTFAPIMSWFVTAMNSFMDEIWSIWSDIVTGIDDILTAIGDLLPPGLENTLDNLTGWLQKLFSGEEKGVTSALGSAERMGIGAFQMRFPVLSNLFDGGDRGNYAGLGSRLGGGTSTEKNINLNVEGVPVDEYLQMIGTTLLFNKFVV